MARKRIERRRLEARTDEVVASIRGGETITHAMRRLGCAYTTLRSIIDGEISDDERREMTRDRRARGSVATRFQPGSVPWNKGRNVGCPAACRATQFKPGQLRGMAARNWAAIGTVRIRRDHATRGQRAGKPRLLKNRPARRFIKVRDDGPPQRRWIPLARYLWELTYGPIPAGMRIVHVDGDVANDDLANLACMTGGEALVHLRRTRPEVERRCAASCGNSARNRWLLYRARQAAPVTYECAACGADYDTEPDRDTRCSKCGSYSFVRVPFPAIA